MTMIRTTTYALALVAMLGAPTLHADDFQGSRHKVDYDGDIIDYSKRTPDSAIEKLQAKIDSGAVKLEYDPKFGWLPSLLKELNISKASQMLVFSKTSLQRTLISPENPRSLFFNDDVYLGFIPGAPLMEISAADPKLGAVFYTLALEPDAKPKFARQTDCNSCHGEARSLGVPGHFVRSIATDETGELDQTSEIRYINQRTPIADRWGGWYVTGQHGNQTHRGNLIGKEQWDDQEKNPRNKPGGNLTSLRKFIDEDKFYGRGSDIVALMVLEHQGQMHNYITRLNFEAQIMLKTYGHLRYLRSQITSFLQYLLLTEEAPLTAPISGNADYVKWFEAQGPFDPKGRSLRQLDMKTRLFKYPCSFLIHSEAFDAMPSQMRDLVLQQLHDILTARDESPEFLAITLPDRKAILEILVATKTNLPAYWRSSVTTSATN